MRADIAICAHAQHVHTHNNDPFQCACSYVVVVDEEMEVKCARPSHLFPFFLRPILSSVPGVE